MFLEVSQYLLEEVRFAPQATTRAANFCQFLIFMAKLHQLVKRFLYFESRLSTEFDPEMIA